MVPVSVQGLRLQDRIPALLVVRAALGGALRLLPAPLALGVDLAGGEPRDVGLPEAVRLIQPSACAATWRARPLRTRA